MKVFMSWSGKRSHEVAQLLGDWLQNVIQAVKPWISSEGIDQGEQWFNRIGSNLGEVNIGIVCLTPENKEAPWIMFEAGALSKGLTDARIMTFLIDLKPQDIRQPLAQFHHTSSSKDDMFKLVTSLNGKLGEVGLPTARLETVFQKYWPDFEERYNAILAQPLPEATPPVRPQSEILSEVLETVRGLKKDMREISAFRNDYVHSAALNKGMTKALADLVLSGYKQGLQMPEIIMNAAKAGIKPSRDVIDFMHHAYETIDHDPSIVGVDFDSGDERR